MELHNISVVSEKDSAGEVEWLSITMFIEEVTAGAERWMYEFGNTKRFKTNLEKFARLRPDGLPPFIEGAPVIA